jgi:hypothetical protein
MAPNTDTRVNIIAWFATQFGFSIDAATALYDVQALNDAQALSELDDDDAVANVCKAVGKDLGASVAELAATKLKLACFWIRHQYRTSREIGGTQRPLVKIKYGGEIDLLKQQKKEEAQWAAARTEPEYPSLTLDTATAAKSLDKAKTFLGKTRGVTGVPLLYVIRVALVPPDDDDDDPPFGEEKSKYVSIDMEMIARAPILSDEADTGDDDDSTSELEANGPFVPTFPVDSRKVWTILVACFGTSSAWQHVKKYADAQNGRQAWRTLHDHFFGGDKVNTMIADVLATLKALHYSGDRKNWTFDKFCTAHVDQHNRHAALAEYDVDPLQESLKIHYFEDGITDPSLAAVKTTILVDRSRFEDFDSVMKVYINFKRAQKPEAPAYQVRNVSAVQGRGGGRQGRGGRGRGGRGGSGGRPNGGIPQEEIDKVTTVEARYYTADEYAKFTPAEKQKLFQLMRAAKAAKNPARTSSNSTTIAELTSAVSAVSAAASAVSELTAASAKRAAADCGVSTDNDDYDNPSWGRNRDNPAVAGRQEHVPKKPRT